MGSLRLVSLNVEHSKHLELVVPFLRKVDPDVFCVQELSKNDISHFEKQIGAGHFVPMIDSPETGGLDGLGIFSKFPIVAHDVHYYRGTAGFLPKFDRTSVATKYVTEHMMLLVCEVMKENVSYRIGTTHFTWTPDGRADNFQRSDLEALLPILKQNEPLVFCGDFNAPRGGEIYRRLSECCFDAVPAHYKTSLDSSLHRAGRERPEELANKMVDYIFTTKPYVATGVELVSGVSDHMAIVATVEKS